MARNSQNVYLPMRLRVGLGVFLGVIAAGTAGYTLLTPMGFVDALYQTVTTLSTVGFREVTPFDTRAKLFTIVLILVGVGTVLYTLTQVMELALEGDLHSRFYQRRQAMRVEQLENHYVLCGFGRVGQEIARELRERGVDFVVIEQTPEEVERARAFGYLVIAGLTAGQLIAGASNATFLGIRHRTGILEVGPRNDSILHDGDVAIVLADEADITAMLAPARGGRT